jgi:tRNA1(Val) A37 N6-methylase TrmN6
VAIGLTADLVVTNPPFGLAGQGRPSRHQGRQAAHVLAVGHSLGDWLSGCLDLVAPRGTLLIIHRADALSDIVAALRGRAGDLTILPVYPRADADATRVLVRARKGSRGPTRLAPPLILHEGDRFSAMATALHDGSSSLAW